MKDEPEFTDVTAEKKIEFFHKVIESDKVDFTSMSRDDLIYYIICMDHFLQARKEFDAMLYLKMRFGKKG